MDVPKKMTLSKEKELNYNPEEPVCGTFNIDVCFGENIRPSSSGSVNPYVIISVPEGTIEAVSQPVQGSKRKTFNIAPETIVRTGYSCVVFRTGSIKSSFNPRWDEKGSFFLPPVDKLEVAVYSRNLLTSDELVGTSIIDLGETSDLKKKLYDFQIHDVSCELEPQGRIMLRLTMDGESDHIAFWFKKTNELLNRTRDGFIRKIAEPVSIN
jgi:hypothetical protein